MEKLIKPFLLICKPYGVTSRKFLNEISLLLNERKVGHVGTLDPMATGLLFVAIGKGTRFIPYLQLDSKEYVIEISLGTLTDTLDTSGKVIDKKPVPNINAGNLRAVLDSSKGEILQKPPLFSAKKYKGKELYKYAYNGEKEIPLSPSKVIIYGIELLSFSAKKLVLRVSCSKGTYMRSLARDIGENLGTYGIISAIARTKIGSFDISKATTFSSLKRGDFKRGFFDFYDIFPQTPKLIIKDWKSFVNGKDFDKDSFFIVEHNGKVLGIAKLKEGTLHPEVVLDENS